MKEKINMYLWLEELRKTEVKGSMPILSFPGIQLLGCTVQEMISSSENQAEGMRLIAQRTPSLASVSLMDLSVEAEAFGSEIIFSEDEVPTVTGHIVSTEEEAEALRVPEVGEKRTGLYIESIRKASERITDRPVFAGIIGSFSLAGRLVDVTEALVYCYTEPDMLKTVLEKATAFLIEYAKGYKAAGANGVVIAEPLAGLLSPDLAAEFSEPYIRKIVEAVQDESFLVIYHNCGNSAIQIIESILRTGAAAYHFGNAIDMKEMMSHIPANIIAMGNIDPAGQFRNGTPESIAAEVNRLLEECGEYQNFVISSGCDIPPLASWENIDAYYAAIDVFYENKK
ncbi:MAG: uroporphyrinogen decarboxylase family protein [Oscillospiraceae bacterium]|nr:uroporphyrinogen decarboxylase family protein [Oscillospiraceae bacterium]